MTGVAAPAAIHDETAGPNAIGASLGLLGDEWSLLIVRFAFAGVSRYGQWKRRLGISDPVLSARLAGLTDAGVFDRAPIGSARQRFDYRLTHKGAGLWPLLLSIWAWELKWAPAGDRDLPVMRHHDCGAIFEPVLRCVSCGAPASADDVTIEPGPSGQMSRSIPTGSNRRRAGAGAVAGPGLFPDTMALLGSRWSSAVLGSAFVGARRFGDFQRWMGAPPAIVSQRLRSFVLLGVLEAASNGGRGEYRLTEKGRDFFGAVSLMVAWGERWMPAPDGPALNATHQPCGRAFVPRLHCGSCSVPLVLPAIEVDPPEMSMNLAMMSTE